MYGRIATPTRGKAARIALPGRAMLETLPSYSFSAGPLDQVASVVAALEANPALPGVLILDGGRFITVLSRERLFETLGKPYGVAVYMNKPIIELLAGNAGLPASARQALHGSVSIDQAVRIALNRTPAERYGPVPIRKADGGFALIDLRTLLLAQTRLLESAATIVAKQGELARTLASTQDLSTVLDAVLDGLSELVSFDKAVIYTTNSSGVERAAERSCLQDGPAPDELEAPPLAKLPGEGWTSFTLDRGGKVLGFLCVRIAKSIVEKSWRDIVESYAASAAVAIGNASLYKELEQLASIDSLTGFANRRSFLEEANRALERALRNDAPIAAIMMDMDRFKSINDEFGHAAGDSVLKDAAATALSELRAGDIAGRLGGEEFAFILPDSSLEAAAGAAERIRSRLSSMLNPLLGKAATASFGIAAIDPCLAQSFDLKAARSLDELIAQADKALYAAKRSGRNRVALSPEQGPARRQSAKRGRHGAQREASLQDAQADPIVVSASAMARGEHFEDIAAIVAQALAMERPGRAVAILRRDRSGKRIELCAQGGFFDDKILEGGLRLGQGCAGIAALERRECSFTLPDAGRAEPSLIAYMAARGYGSYRAIPFGGPSECAGVIEIFDRSISAQEGNAKPLSAILAAAESHDRSIQNAREASDAMASSIDETLEAWARVLELRDQETEGHSRRVSALTIELAKSLGVPESEYPMMRRGALLHDIGKMGVPDAVLLKPGALSAEERGVMAQHPGLAQAILSRIAFLGNAVDIPYCHHERWDGTGYPRGLKAQEIPLSARIFAIVDVWDALRSDRPYRSAMSEDQASAIIAEGSGSQFDPRVAKHFLQLIGSGAARKQ
jgi:diguanylate cyclase (GGDEF)-like protein/putative nucleotidyltransferase with HDIG domain